MRPAGIVSAIMSRPIVLAGAALLAIAAAGVLGARNAETEAPVEIAMTAGEARAIGAEWRRTGGDALARRYADALAAAGLHDELLTEISNRGLFAGAPAAAAAYRAEAYFQVGRYGEALAAAPGDNPYFAFARARSRYALTGDARAVEKDLAAALRGPQTIAAQAFLLRARIALDANDLPTASAAARRAAEEGAAASAVDTVEVEALIRDGRVDEAAARIAAMPAVLRKSSATLRLAAMVELRRGRAREAARYFDRAGVPTSDRLLAALAKWQAGDDAQGLQLVEAHLAAAPDHWAAIDLYLAMSDALGVDEDRRFLAGRLLEKRPGLGVIRMLREGGDNDQLYGALATLTTDEDLEGASDFLLGRKATLRGFEPARDNERALIALAAARSTGELRKQRMLAERNARESATALQLTLAGATFADLGDDPAAEAALKRAGALAPEFFAPVNALANLRARAGDLGGAISLLSDFVKRESGVDARLALASFQTMAGETTDAADTYAALPPAELFADQATAAAYGRAARAAGEERLETMLAAARANAPSAAILSAALLAAGDDRGAVAALRRSLIADPANATAAADYRDAMARLGRGDEAILFLDQIERRRKAFLRDPGGGGDSPKIALKSLNSGE